MSDDYWFRPKTFGWGVTPASWQGWALTAGYIVLLIADLTQLHIRASKWIIAAALTAAFLAIAAQKTEGGLGWRWGGRDR